MIIPDVDHAILTQNLESNFCVLLTAVWTSHENKSENNMARQQSRYVFAYRGRKKRLDVQGSGERVCSLVAELCSREPLA
jgi:hypothetical protein